MRDTSQKGLISQTAVLHRLVRMGYEIVLPLADHLGYDLAYVENVEQENGISLHCPKAHLVRVQVKTAWLSKDLTCLHFNTSTVSARKNGKNHKSGYHGKAEIFAVFSPDTGKIYMIPVEGTRVGHMTLRFKTAGVIGNNGKQKWHFSYIEAMESKVKYNWAEDYELSEEITIAKIEQENTMPNTINT